MIKAILNSPSTLYKDKPIDMCYVYLYIICWGYEVIEAGLKEDSCVMRFKGSGQMGWTVRTVNED